MRRHRTDLVSLVIGLIFLTLAAWWLLVEVTDAVVPAVGWLVAAGMILLGVLGLIVNVRADLHHSPPGPGGNTPDVG